MDVLAWIATSLVVLIAYYALARKKTSSKDMPPQVAGAWPIVGHGLKLSDPTIYDEWRQKHGDVYTIFAGTKKTVVVHDLELMKNCLRAEELGFLEIIEQQLKFDADVFPRNTLPRNHQNLSIMKMSIFSRISSAESVIVDSCREIVNQKLKSSPDGKLDTDIIALAKLVVGDSTGRVVFQVDLPTEFYDECAKLEVIQIKAFRSMALAPFRNKYFKRWMYKDYMASFFRLYETYLKSVVQDHRKNPGRSVFIDSLVNFKAEDDKSGLGAYDDVEISHQIVGIVLASMSNTTLLTTHVLTSLMRDKSYFERVRDEVRGVDGTKSPTPVLEAFVYECARMACMSTGSMRLAMQDLKIVHGDTEYIVPAGDAVLIPHYAKNYNPELFSDPHTFNPDRFLTLKEKKSDVMNWGGGIHLCPGKNLALSEARVIAATLIQNYDLEPKDLGKYGKMVWSSAGTAISPIDGINAVSIKKRAV